jgi:hypothetical protein
VAGDWTKSKLNDIEKAHSGPSNKNCVEVNNKSVEEVNMPHSPVICCFEQQEKNRLFCVTFLSPRVLHVNHYKFYGFV